MEILVVTQSVVVEGLFRVVEQNAALQTTFCQSAKELEQEYFDVIFIDDIVPNLKEEIDYIHENIQFLELVLLGKENHFHLPTIAKPFLPQDIYNFLEQVKVLEDLPKKEPPNVLDPYEIEKIKALLKLEESEEKQIKNDYLNRLVQKESLTLKNKKAKKLIKLLCSLSKKERKKLLKDATITLKISFGEVNE